MVESLLLTSVPIATYLGDRLLTRATGFFFERDARLYLVTSRHVVVDAPSAHFPDRIDITVHLDVRDMTSSIQHSIALYRDGTSTWRQGSDSGGEIDVAVLEVDRARLPTETVFVAFSPEHLVRELDEFAVGDPLLIVGFPLGFHDTRHHLPVVRHAIIASAFGVRFQGQGCFLTDARTHRGTSGAPVVAKRAADVDTRQGLPFRLLGVHSSRFDIGTRDRELDESLGLNSAWYADIVLTLTQDPPRKSSS
ncbi:MAG TPA: serine protease [Burkholderiaceae bacterium]|nr:serine protease [Burkholderiaceae bacterium]